MLHGTCQSHCRKNPVENPDSSAINRDGANAAPSLFSFYRFPSPATLCKPLFHHLYDCLFDPSSTDHRSMRILRTENDELSGPDPDEKLRPVCKN